MWSLPSGWLVLLPSWVRRLLWLHLLTFLPGGRRRLKDTQSSVASRRSLSDPFFPEKPEVNKEIAWNLWYCKLSLSYAGILVILSKGLFTGLGVTRALVNSLAHHTTLGWTLCSICWCSSQRAVNRQLFVSTQEKSHGNIKAPSSLVSEDKGPAREAVGHIIHITFCLQPCEEPAPNN